MPPLLPSSGSRPPSRSSPSSNAYLRVFSGHDTRCRLHFMRPGSRSAPHQQRPCATFCRFHACHPPNSAADRNQPEPLARNTVASRWRRWSGSGRHTARDLGARTCRPPLIGVANRTSGGGSNRQNGLPWHDNGQRGSGQSARAEIAGRFAIPLRRRSRSDARAGIEQTLPCAVSGTHRRTCATPRAAVLPDIRQSLPGTSAPAKPRASLVGSCAAVSFPHPAAVAR